MTTRGPWRGPWTIVSWLFVAALVLACNKREDSPQTTLNVFAASSLTEAFQALEQGFEAKYPEVDLSMTSAGSQVLRLQIEQGAAADVFASANQEHVAALVQTNLAADPRAFAQNELVLIVPAESDHAIDSIDHLIRADRIVIGSKQVPVGLYTHRFLDKLAERNGSNFVTRIRDRVVSEESNVRLVRAKVELGEADAAFVYRTDAISSENVRIVPFPDELRLRTECFVARVSGSNVPKLAQRFIAFIRAAEGQAILAEHGFLTSS